MKVELLLSIVLAISTVFYTIINLMMWFESRAARKQKTDALIIAYLKYSDDDRVVYLFMENIGEGCAENVTLSALPDYERFMKWPLSESNPFKNGINIFPSKEKINIALNLSAKTELDKDCFILEIKYNNLNSYKQKTNVYTLHFGQIESSYRTPPVTFMGQIPYYLKELNKTLMGFQKQ